DLLIIDKEENLLDIEPQESKEKHIIDRLTAYTAGLIYSQLHAGDGYQELKMSSSPSSAKTIPSVEAMRSRRSR
ncbi:MAG: hypothetical protein J6A47_10515, partial [Bacilli bacterium]|nr:hypothetical protein [Bacilli bacterium]